MNTEVYSITVSSFHLKSLTATNATFQLNERMLNMHHSLSFNNLLTNNYEIVFDYSFVEESLFISMFFFVASGEVSDK